LCSALSTLEDPIDRAFVTDFQVSTLARDVPELLDIAVEESLQVPLRVWRETFRGFVETHDFSAQLSRVQAPTLIVWGDCDAYSQAAEQEALRAAIPGARLIVHGGAGHAMHWEDPARVANDLVSFLYERRGATDDTGGAHQPRTVTAVPQSAA
jgi:pimeloyl-ACP methyl ester carboxylesterase